ncbi:MAG TPA: MBL fold metallo-hydrolase, partial [Opitutaceae bacterium]|nr:MBL fold metallo-hydrolase [Opitutaceae bacterium]
MLRPYFRFWLAAFGLAALAPAQAKPIDSTYWHVAFPSFRIAGNLYYVGTADLAVYLIATPKGNILINTDFPFDLSNIRAGIARLGFRYEDTKILLISHGHMDHDAAAGEVQRETGAQLMVMAPDVAQVEERQPRGAGAHVNRVLHDGDTVELGGSALTALLTPGHTPGCTTWTMTVHGRLRDLSIVIVGSANVNPGTYLVKNRAYPRIAEDYVHTFAVLKGLHPDIFLGAHGAYFG